MSPYYYDDNYYKNKMENGNCPICNKEYSRMIRYPKSICGDCRVNTVDENGYKVTFHNIDEYGGFQSHHTNNNLTVIKEEHTCYVAGIKCFAEENRFGGIVIQTVNG